MEISHLPQEIELKMAAMQNEEQARHLMRFFKCGKGEYGEGDRFLGIRVPQTRAIVKEYRKRATIDDAIKLTLSPWHEVRLTGFLLMVDAYKRLKKSFPDSCRVIVDKYISSLDRANNWDLVDLSTPYILGDWLIGHPEDKYMLDHLSDMADNLWHQRAAMVANWTLIRNDDYDTTFRIAEKYISHGHDLIHKATGWMLREVGKHGGETQLRQFLNIHAPKMPRTMLRYAIEKFPENDRQHYLKLK